MNSSADPAVGADTDETEPVEPLEAALDLEAPAPAVLPSSVDSVAHAATSNRAAAMLKNLIGIKVTLPVEKEGIHYKSPCDMPIICT